MVHDSIRDRGRTLSDRSPTISARRSNASASAYSVSALNGRPRSAGPWSHPGRRPFFHVIQRAGPVNIEFSVIHACDGLVPLDQQGFDLEELCPAMRLRTSHQGKVKVRLRQVPVGGRLPYLGALTATLVEGISRTRDRYAGLRSPPNSRLPAPDLRLRAQAGPILCSCCLQYCRCATSICIRRMAISGLWRSTASSRLAMSGSLGSGNGSVGASTWAGA
jgi:hypothetical protein